MFHTPLIIMSRKYFFDFRSSRLPFDIRFWTRGFPLKMRSQKAGLPFATRARKLLSIQEVRIENDSDRKFSKSKFFKVFLKTTFLHDSCYPDHYKPKFCLKIGKNENFDYKIFSNKIKVFLETTFVHVSCYSDHYELKIFFRFSKSATTLRYTNLDSRFPP